MIKPASTQKQPRKQQQSDWNLVNSVREVLNLIDSIDNLLSWSEDLENGSLLDTESVTLLRENTFPSRQNKLSLRNNK